MSTTEIVELARRLREAQRNYYRSKFPGEKQGLLVKARQMESEMDKALAATPAAAAEPLDKDQLVKELAKAEFEVDRILNQLNAWTPEPPASK